MPKITGDGNFASKFNQTLRISSVGLAEFVSDNAHKVSLNYLLKLLKGSMKIKT